MKQHSIYTYQNQADTDALIEYLHKTCPEISIVQAKSHADNYSIKGENGSIEIDTTKRQGEVSQAGGIFLLADSDSPLHEVFKSIKKYVKATYQLSDDRHNYIAPHMMQDWLDFKVEFPALLRRKEYTISSDVFSLADFTQHLIELGYVVKENGKDIRLPDTLELGGEDYIITTRNAKLKSIIVARKQYYIGGSECIFLNIRKTKNETRYIFHLDERLSDNKGLIELFDTIKNFE